MKFVNNVKTAGLLGALIGLCMVCGYLAGGPQGLIFGLILGGGANIVAFFFSDKIAIASMRGREIQRADSPRLFAMIERLAERANLPMPKVYVCPQPAPNAFATGRSPRKAAVAITQGMLDSFPEHEVEAVMAHELAHIKHRDMLTGTIAAVLAGVIIYSGRILWWFGGGGRRDDNNPLGAIGLLIMVLLAPFAAMFIQMAISRQREYEADRLGGELAGDPLKLAHALARLQHGNERIATDTNPAFHSMYIMKPFSREGLASLFSTHPPTEERIRRLQAQAGAMR